MDRGYRQQRLHGCKQDLHHGASFFKSTAPAAATTTVAFDGGRDQARRQQQRRDSDSGQLHDDRDGQQSEPGILRRDRVSGNDRDAQCGQLFRKRVGSGRLRCIVLGRLHRLDCEW